MKPLNRPMFRYGGPIKEGVMSGIREPRQNYNEAGSVKPVNQYRFGETPIAKGAKGFTNYGINSGLAAIADFANVPLNTIGRMFGYNPGFSGTKQMDLLTGGAFSKNTKYSPDKAYFLGIPTSAKQGFTLPSMKVQKNLDKLGDKENRPFVNTNKNTSVVSNQTTDNRTAKEIQADRIQKYRDIMDIKGMNKTAAYNSLIAASQLINQEDDFKGSLKDGSLISKLIGATSKAFDKPSQTKDAIDTLILKGEIEKDIKASDPSNALDAEYKRTKIAESKKALNPSFSALKSAYGKIDQSQAGITGAAKEYSKNNNQEYRGSIVSKADFNKIKKNIKEESGNLDEVDIIAKWTQETIKGKNLPDGNYIVGDNIVTIEKGIVKAVE